MIVAVGSGAGFIKLGALVIGAVIAVVLITSVKNHKRRIASGIGIVFVGYLLMLPGLLAMWGVVDYETIPYGIGQPMFFVGGALFLIGIAVLRFLRESGER